MHSILRSTPIRAGLAVGATVLLAVATFAASRSWAATLLVLVGLILVFAFVTLTTMRLGNTVSLHLAELGGHRGRLASRMSRATFHAKEASERSNELKREMRALPGAAPSDVGRGVQASDSLEGIVLDGVIRRAGTSAPAMALTNSPSRLPVTRCLFSVLKRSTHRFRTLTLSCTALHPYRKSGWK